MKVIFNRFIFIKYSLNLSIDVDIIEVKKNFKVFNILFLLFFSEIIIIY